MQAAMNIGGQVGGGGNARWAAAAGAGGNPYLYGGMGGAVTGGYGEMQQQYMLPGGVAYSSMDAMFGVGGQMAQGEHTDSNLV